VDETNLEKLARLSGKAASKALGALERRGYDIRGKLSAPISRVPRRNPQKPKSDDRTPPQMKGNTMDHTVEEATSPAQQRIAQPTIGGSVYVKPQEIAWEPTQFEGISIKVLYEDKPKGEMTCLLKWEPGATLPMHKHAEIEQTYVIEGSFYDHDGICRAGEFVWRRVGSYHETHSDEGAIILAAYRKPNVFQHSTGYARDREP
jgi:quercetin dioxygenase-like cupin family protein